MKKNLRNLKTSLIMGILLDGRTKVIIEVISVPEGWSVIITDNILVEEGEGSRTTVYLIVKPPKGFGYH